MMAAVEAFSASSGGKGDELEGKDAILELEKCEFGQGEEEEEELVGETADGEESDQSMEDDEENSQLEEELDGDTVFQGDGYIHMDEDDFSIGMKDGDDVQGIEELKLGTNEVNMNDALSKRKEQKEFQIYVTGLSKDANEDDLMKVFGVFGEIRATRILKNPLTKRSRGNAFITFATVDQAKRALNQLKGGIEVIGKRVDISAGEDNDTLYVGNICRTWSKEYVLRKMRGCGIKHIKELYRPKDPVSEGNYKGFVLLEFSNHVNAVAAFQRLRKYDAVFGCERSARVKFAHSSKHPCEELFLQVKTVYIEGIPDSWGEEKLIQHCKQYGEVKKIHLSENLADGKPLNVAYVSFTSSESAVTCVDAIKNPQVEEGGTKLKARLARPQNKERLMMRGTRGGFKVRTNLKREGQFSRLEGHAISKSFQRKIFQDQQKREYWWEGGAEKEKESKSLKKSPENLQKRSTNVLRALNATTSYHQRGYDPGLGSKRQSSNMRPYSGYHGSSSGRGRGFFGYGQIISDFYESNPSTAASYAGDTTSGYSGGTAAGYIRSTAGEYTGGTAPRYVRGTGAGYVGYAYDNNASTATSYGRGSTSDYAGGTAGNVESTGASNAIGGAAGLTGGAAGYAGAAAAGHARGTTRSYAGVPAPGYAVGPAPGHAGPPTPGYHEGHTPVYTGGPTPGYHEGLAPGYARATPSYAGDATLVPAPEYAGGPDPGYHEGPASGYARGTTPSYGRDAALGYAVGPAPEYAGGPTPGHHGGPAPGYNEGPAAGHARGTTPSYAGDTTPGYAVGPATGYAGGPAPEYSGGRYDGSTTLGYAGGSDGRPSYSVQYPNGHGHESGYPHPSGSHVYTSGAYPPKPGYQINDETYPPGSVIYPTNSTGPYPPSGDSYFSMTRVAYPHATNGAYQPRKPYY